MKLLVLEPSEKKKKEMEGKEKKNYLYKPTFSRHLDRTKRSHCTLKISERKKKRKRETNTL